MILVVYEALESLEKVFAENDSCANLSFYIGYLKLAIGLENEAIENFTVAIDKCDDNHPSHFIWKGIAQCLCGAYEEGLNEFRIALGIQADCYQAALYKGRCYLQKKDIDRALYAFKDFMEAGPDEEEEIKHYLGNFFFSNGLVTHARQTYEEALDVKQAERTLRELVKVYIVEKNLFLALDKLELLCQDYYQDAYNFDLNILYALRAAAALDYPEASILLRNVYEKTTSGFIFSESDIQFYMGTISFYLKDYAGAVSQFEKVFKSKYNDTAGRGSTAEEELINGLFEEESEEVTTVVSHTFTKSEIEYNIGLCYLCMGRYPEAVKRLSLISQHPKLAGATDSLIEVLKKAMDSSDIDFTDESVCTVNIFPSNNRLCGIYEELRHKLTNQVEVAFRLSFCLPSVEPPSMLIKVGFEILLDLKITSVENRPEAPWIKRSTEGIIFTNNIIQSEVTEISDLSELLLKMSSNKNEMMNTKIKLNAEKIFETKVSQFHSSKDDKSKPRSHSLQDQGPEEGPHAR